MPSELTVPKVRHANIKVEYGVPAKMRDGITLFADVYRPDVNVDLPVLLLRTPYDKSMAQTTVFLNPAWYARYGYIVIVQDCRGRYSSEGNWCPYDAEVADGHDSVEWAADLGGSNGSVAMYGFSYPGAIQLQAASTQPRGLKTIVPAMTASDFYDGWTYEGGALSQAFVQSWILYLAQDTARRAGDFDQQKLLWEDFMELPSAYWKTPINKAVRDADKYAPYYLDWLKHDTYDEYWSKKSIRNYLPKISIPVLHIGGWYDIFISGTIRNYIELNKLAAADKTRGQQKLVIGPWHHLPWQQQVGSSDFGEKARNNVNLLQLKWLDQHLRDAEPVADDGSSFNADSDDANVSVFVLNLNEWKSLNEWPPANAAEKNLYLHSGGRANSLSGDGTLSQIEPGQEPWDAYLYDPSSPVVSSGGHSCCFEELAPMGPNSQRKNEMRNDVLVYTSEVLNEDVTVMGLVRLKLFASTTAVDTDFSAVLTDVSENGYSMNIVNTILRASRRESLSEPISVEPNKVYEYNIELGWTAAMFKAGHRIRIDIASSNFPHHGRTPNSNQHPSEADLNDWKVARQTIHHDSQYPSHIILPVV
jgi:putative CocE/NonD family hydrolase